MKHNNDTTHVGHNTFSKKPLRYRVTLLLIIALFCCVVLASANQTFSRTDLSVDSLFTKLSVILDVSDSIITLILKSKGIFDYLFISS